MACFVQLSCGGQSSRARSYHGYLFAGLDVIFYRFDVPFLISDLNDMLLDLLNGYGIFVNAQHTGRFAWSWTYASRKFGEVVCRNQNIVGFFPFTIVDSVVKFGNDIAQWTA